MSKQEIKQFMNQPIPLWMFLVALAIIAINISGNHDQHFQDAKDLDRRVTILENRRY